MSSNTKPHTRVFAFLGALLFFVTSCALTGAVLWQIHQDNQKNKSAAVSSVPGQSANNTKPSDKGTKLQGTKLANYTPASSVATLQSIDTVAGNGQEVKSGDTITAHYTGAVAATGIIFQSSHDSGSPVTFGLAQVIPGWQQGVPGMKVGGTRRLLIPAAQGYGGTPPPNSGIPANADLVFDIELVSIGK
ncbi:MAG: FKBP-type peptidyl-prolyl cis-trans isomerase [Candidatus Saccharimonadales bacterium]